MRIFLLLLLWLWAPPGARATTEETEAGARLTTEATEFLDQMLGVGRAKVLVTVQGEKSEVRTQTETTTPITINPNKKNTEEQRFLLGNFLPGYIPNQSEKDKDKDKDKVANYDYLQKDQEQSLRQSGLLIKSIHATVILDAALSEVQVNMVRRVMPDLLRMDANRGDLLTVLRAPLLPPWQKMLLGSEGMRILLQDGTKALFWFVTTLFLILFIAVIGYFIAMRVIRTFFAEVVKVKGAEAGSPALPAARGREEELTELLPGGIPSLEQAEAGPAAGRAVAALGQRFDFLTSHPLTDVAEYLSKEKPEDLALLFGYLSEARDSLATRLFAILPVNLQNEVSQHLSKLNTADPETLAMLENRLRTSVEFGIRGADRLGRILSRIPAQQREGILGDMMSRDPSMAEKVESSMIPFESLAEVQPAELRRLLTAVPYQEWGTALRGIPDEMVKRVLELLPAEAQAALRDYLEQPQPMDQVLEARSKILSVAYALAAKGQLSIRRADSAQLL